VPSGLHRFFRYGVAVYGGERSESNQMPVEESGNLLLLVAALAKVEGNAESSRAYWRF
jgi:hypothetical protein